MGWSGAGAGWIGLGSHRPTDRQHRRPEQGRGRQESGVCWAGSQTDRQHKAEVGGVELEWVGVSQRPTVLLPSARQR